MFVLIRINFSINLRCAGSNPEGRIAETKINAVGCKSLFERTADLPKKLKVNITLEQVMKAQKGSGGVAVL
jgi:hypothetical protein